MIKITIKALAKMIFQPCPISIPHSYSRDAKNVDCFSVSLNQVPTPKLLISLFTEGNFEGFHRLVLVASDKLACFIAAMAAGCGHTRIKSAGRLELFDSRNFKWVTTIIGNIKTALTATCHLNDSKNLSRYLTALFFSFDSRKSLPFRLK